MLTFGSLFSGCGTFDLGLERAGLTCAWQCEADATCRDVLAKHWPDVYCYTDVRKVDASAARVDLLCGGWPCQDLSVAGKRAGLAGARSGLFHEFVRVARQLRPRWILGENVPGLLSSHGGRDMATVVESLGQLGYFVAWRVLDAQYFGVAQRRRRVFVVASLGDASCAEILFERDCLPGDSAASREAGEGVADCLTAGAHPGSHNGQDDHTRGRLVVGQCHGSNVGEMGTLRRGSGMVSSGVPFVAHALTSCKSATERLDPNGETFIPIDLRQSSRGATMTNNRRAGSTGGAPGVGVGEAGEPAFTVSARGQAVAYRTSGNCGVTEQGDRTAALNCATDPTQNIVGVQMGVRRLTPTECERLQGLPDQWTRYGASGKEISDSRRYQMIGNAGAVPVLEWLGRRIMAAANTPNPGGESDDE